MATPIAFAALQSLIRNLANAYRYDPALLAAQAHQESRFDPGAVSPAGARGLMQFMPATWRDWGRDKNPHDAAASLDAGIRYMQSLLQRYHGAEEPLAMALAAYNWGMGNVDGAIRKAGGSGFSSVAPFLPAETRAYVPAILGRVPFYRAIYGAAKVAIPGLAVGLLGFFGFLVFTRLVA